MGLGRITAFLSVPAVNKCQRSGARLSAKAAANSNIAGWLALSINGIIGALWQRHSHESKSKHPRANDRRPGARHEGAGAIPIIPPATLQPWTYLGMA